MCTDECVIHPPSRSTLKYQINVISRLFLICSSDQAPNPESAQTRDLFQNHNLQQKMLIRVSVQGVESLWGDCRFIPADWGS